MAVIVAAKGGAITDVTVGDVLQLADIETSAMAAWPRDLPAFYSALKELGILGADTPARWRQLRTPGQRTPEELVDRYDIACQPVRHLLVDYRITSLSFHHSVDSALGHNVLIQAWWSEGMPRHDGV